MNKNTHENHQSKNVQLVIVFVGLVGFLLAISFTVKFFSILKKGKYDGYHRFTIAVISTEKQPYHKKVVSLSPENDSLSVLEIPHTIANTSIEKFLGIPIQGSIYTITTSSNIEKDLRNALVHFSSNSTITIVDLTRMWWYVLTSNMTQNTKKIDVDFTEKEIDQISSSLFTDYSLSQEKSSIQIVNGTEVSGLGNRLARVITNMGGNVVSVDTSEQLSKTSEVFCISENYACKRLSMLLGYTYTITNRQDIADVIIKIGKNGRERIQF